MLLNQWLINKMPGTDKHNFGYSVDIYSLNVQQILILYQKVLMTILWLA